MIVFRFRFLNCFSAHGTCFLLQSICHHAQICCRTLICFTALSFHPFLVLTFRGYHNCVGGVSPACKVIRRMFDAVHFSLSVIRGPYFISVWEILSHLFRNLHIKESHILNSRKFNKYVHIWDCDLCMDIHGFI